MRIVHYANFRAGGNDDEGAILHALRELGHDVEPVQEGGNPLTRRFGNSPDLLLFHKGAGIDVPMFFWGTCPRAFWYWDLVEFPQDHTLARRDAGRRAWMNSIIAHVEFGFCSDGDWVAKDKTGKLRWLPQGADGRIVGRGDATAGRALVHRNADADLLLTASHIRAGTGRISFIRQMLERYGDWLIQLDEGVHRERLRDLTAACRITVCPDAPVTGRYWSNRVWNAAGFGAFVLHPFCDGLQDFYTGRAITYYRNREHLHGLIADYLDEAADETRRIVSENAMTETKAKNLYRHRVEQLIRTVKGNTEPPGPVV